MPWGRPGRRGGPACSRGDGALGVAAGAGLGLVAAVRLDALPALRLVQRQRLGLGRAGLELDALVAELGGDLLEAQEDRTARSEEHTSETPVTNAHLVCRLLLEKKKKRDIPLTTIYKHTTTYI